MHTTPSGGHPSTGPDLFVRFGDEPVLGRLPLRQGWQLLPEDQPPGFAPQLRQPDSRGSKFTLIQRGSQGEIWALNERALREGRQAVERAHRGAVRFGPPTVHTYLCPLRRVPMEPLMFVKVNARREHLDPILHELRARGARMQEVELQGRRVILRAEARLPALLGFEDVVLSISTHSAQVFAWLVRYEAAAQAAEIGQADGPTGVSSRVSKGEERKA